MLLPPVLDEAATSPSRFTPKWIKELVDLTAKVTNISHVHASYYDQHIWWVDVPSAQRMAAWVDPAAIWML